MQINDILNDGEFWSSAGASIIDAAERHNIFALAEFFKNHSNDQIRAGSTMAAMIGATIPGTSPHCMGFLLGIKAILDYQQAQEHSPSAIEIRELERMMGQGNDPQI